MTVVVRALGTLSPLGMLQMMALFAASGHCRGFIKNICVQERTGNPHGILSTYIWETHLRRKIMVSVATNLNKTTKNIPHKF